MQNAATDFISQGGWPMTLTVILSCIGGLACIGSMLECLPSLLATLVRWKESDNLSSSAHLSRCRNTTASAMLLPFLLIATRYSFAAPLASLHPLPRLGMTAAVWAAYLLLRLLLRLVFRPNIYDRKGWNSGARCHYSFFILMVLLMLTTMAVCSVFNPGDDVVRKILLGEIMGLYVLSLIRKLQLFAHFRGVFSGILYLCTLEFIPTGLLVAADVLIQTWQLKIF